MPNWTSNRIHITGKESDIRAFLEAVKGQDELVDFNRIIPMPPLLSHADRHSWQDQHWSTWNASNVFIKDENAIKHGHVELAFETAWCEPEPIYRKLFEMFQALTFTCEWEHEDNDDCTYRLTSETREPS